MEGSFVDETLQPWALYYAVGGDIALYSDPRGQLVSKDAVLVRSHEP